MPINDSGMKTWAEPAKAWVHQMNEKYISRSPAVAARLLGDEMFIMSAVDSKLFSLNRTATAIWLAADGKTPLSEIVKTCVCARRRVDPSVAYNDAVEFAQALAQQGILNISDQPSAALPDESATIL
jgi:hypothetical protein